MGDFKTLIYEKKDALAYVMLNRPERLNTYNIRMRDELVQILEAIRADEEVGAVIFDGAGDKAFSAGADLSEFLTAPSPVLARQVRFERDVWDLFLNIPQPLIAAVHGYVLGSGLEIALFCDLRVASDDALFGFPEGSLGIIPAAGGTQSLPRTVGWGGALDMLLTGRTVSAEEAYEIGLVNRLVPRSQLMPTAEALARKILSYNPLAVKNAKRAVNQGSNLNLEEGLELERRLAALTAAGLHRT